MKKINVLLVEDDPVWAEGFLSLLRSEPDFEVIRVSDREEALSSVILTPWDVALIDIGLGKESLGGLELAEEITRRQPDCRVIMLTSMEEQDVMLEAFRSGAVNYITKYNYKDVPDAVRAAYRNEASIHPCSSSALRREMVRQKRREEERLLSPSEQRILRLVHGGHTYNQISKALFITERTIKNHMNRILKKLKANSGREAAELAARKGLLEKTDQGHHKPGEGFE